MKVLLALLFLIYLNVSMARPKFHYGDQVSIFSIDKNSLSNSFYFYECQHIGMIIDYYTYNITEYSYAVNIDCKTKVSREMIPEINLKLIREHE